MKRRINTFISLPPTLSVAHGTREQREPVGLGLSRGISHANRAAFVGLEWMSGEGSG